MRRCTVVGRLRQGACFYSRCLKFEDMLNTVALQRTYTIVRTAGAHTHPRGEFGTVYEAEGVLTSYGQFWKHSVRMERMLVVRLHRRRQDDQLRHQVQTLLRCDGR